MESTQDREGSCHVESADLNTTSPSKLHETQESAPRKRRRYVRKACVNCRTRKARCSGDEICSECQLIGAQCEYPQSRKKRKEQPRDTPASQGGLDATDQEDEWLRMLARVDHLETSYSMLRSKIESPPQNMVTHRTPSVSMTSDPSSGTDDSTFATLPERENFRGVTAFVAQLNALDKSIARDPLAQVESRAESRATSPPALTWSAAPRGTEMTLVAIEQETRQHDLAALRQSVDTYFQVINPHHPSLNENWFRSLFDKFIANQELTELSYADQQQFIALINLIHAEVCILTEECTTSVRVPAWETFCRAENILGRLTWLGNGNYLTIQCLLVKARYLLYAEKAYGAYDTMGRVVRLCWQLGLHYQPSWNLLSEFEVIMRQRVFWSIFYLDRHISLTTGAPYLIRQDEMEVDLPPSIEDHLLFESRPPPPVPGDAEKAADPYLLAGRERARLASDIWDVVCTTKATKPTNAELIATMDSRVQFKQRQIAPILCWSNNASKLDGTTETPRHIIRQSAIINQRMNMLRLLVRQERMLTLNFDDKMASDCIEIASSNINAVRDVFHSPSHLPLDRFSSYICLTVSLLPLVCIIVKTSTDPTSRTQAIESYHQAMALLQDMAPHFSSARHSLQRMRRLIRTTERAIRRFHLAEVFPLDPNEFELETLVPQISGSFGGPDLQPDWGLDFINSDLDGSFDLSTNPILDFASPYTLEQLGNTFITA